MTGESADGIRIDGVTKRYGSVLAVDDVTFSIDRGTYHCLLGPNGSGKTTLLRMILGLTRPDSGTITTGESVLGCGFQSPNFYPGLSVRENIHVFASVAGADDWDWNQQVVDELRLNPALDRKAADLSGGFSRKLDLALALVKQPDFLLLDEPLGALDDVSRVRFLEFLDGYVDRGNTVFVSSHQVSAFEPYLDRVTLLHEGQVVLDSAVGDIDLGPYDSLQSYYVTTVLQREDVEDFEDSVVD